MTLDRSFIESNRASTIRIRDLIARLSDDDLKHRMGEHWTIAVALVHLAFWDNRVLVVIDASEKAGTVSAATIDIAVNDISLPIWLAVPPRKATRLALEMAEKLDQRLEALSPEAVEQLMSYNLRYVFRALHRNEHLDEIEEALKG